MTLPGDCPAGRSCGIRFDFKFVMIKKLLPYLIAVAICFLLGFVASQLQTDAVDQWYPTLRKPALTPPNWLFPVAWSTLYLLSGISAGLIWNKAGDRRKSVITLWCTQQFFNFTWSILFFTFQSPLLGFLNILILDVLVLWYILRAWPISKAASIMFWPYLIWILFASYLNGYIMVMN